jgi:hypothetical protein
MDNNDGMESQIDIEGLRARLKAMSRADVLELAKAAELSPSTVQKFRSGVITEPGGFKVQALVSALKAMEVA